MAMEVLKTAAVTYQGSASSAAKPAKAVKAEKPQKAEKPASEPDNSKTAGSISAEDNAKDLRLFTGSSEEKNDDGSSGSYQTSKQLQEAVEKIRKNMMANTEAVFGIHEGTNRVMIKIVDKDSKDVIKEYPLEQTLDMMQKVWEMAGIMVDEKG